jgi:hypothetical protein
MLRVLDVDAELFWHDCALLTNEAQKAEPIKSETEQHKTIQITQRMKVSDALETFMR